MSQPAAQAVSPSVPAWLPERQSLTRPVAWTLWIITALQVAFGFVLGALDHLDVRGLFADYLIALACGALAFASMGVLVVTRQRANPIGWIFCVLGVGFGTGWMTEYARLGLVTAPGSLPAAELVNWVNRWLWMPLLALVAVYLPLLFPDGRLPSRRWRLAAGLAAVATASMAVNFAIAPGPVDASEPDLPNPFSPDWAPAVLPILTRIATLLAVVSLVSGASASIVRFKRATDERERAQLKWFAYALGILVVALVAPLVVGFPHATEDTLLSGVLTCFGFAAIPIATGIAIVRYRLFDIDQLISRTLLYAALTGCVVGVYLFIVGYLGAVLRVGNDLVVSLVATAIVAVIFQPLRDHLQRAIARLLYGRRDEPYVVLSRLDRQLANSLAPDDVLSTIVTELRS
ncbi:MAG: histidine kinase, partial [Chloroflexi bacterium]|nr:histidine kinase [Chloroflexota bacterium]